MSVRKDEMQKSSSWQALGVDEGEEGIQDVEREAAAPNVVQVPHAWCANSRF
jgi:hypothetical protein